MRDTCNLCAQEMTLLSREKRVSVQRCVQVASKNVLDIASSLHVCWCRVWKLDPILQEAVRDPVDETVHPSSARFHIFRDFALVCLLCFSFNHVVVREGPKKLSPEAQGVRARELPKPFDRFVESENLVLAERDAGPLEHLVLGEEVRNCTLVSLLDESTLSGRETEYLKSAI